MFPVRSPSPLLGHKRPVRIIANIPILYPRRTTVQETLLQLLLPQDNDISYIKQIQVFYQKKKKTDTSWDGDYVSDSSSICLLVNLHILLFVCMDLSCICMRMEPLNACNSDPDVKSSEKSDIHPLSIVKDYRWPFCKRKLFLTPF